MIEKVDLMSFSLKPVLSNVFFTNSNSRICGSGLFSQLCLTLATPWIVTHQTPLSMRFPRQEYWSVLPFPSPVESSQPRNQTPVS